jgi:hypothetical protein
MLHELWEDPDDDGRWTFVFAGPMGDDARAWLGSRARLTWTVEASSHFEAMTLYYEHQGWAPYTTDFPEEDRQPYAELGWE